MSRFFTDRTISDDEFSLTISGSDKRHMADVLRLRPGAQVEIADTAGNSYECVISSYDPDNAYLNIVRKISQSNEPGHRIILYQGLPKSDKLEHIIQKATELGVSEVIPVLCSRSIPKFRDDKDILKKTERWQKISSEAAKQTGRDIVPVVRGPVSFREAAEQAVKANISFIPWECEKQTDFRQFLRKSRGSEIQGTIAFIIGPEGGFEDTEIAYALKLGITPVTLGRRILRTETAGPAVLSMLMYEYELGGR
ncbi:MAG: RsmE family RNA methyltransferase [Saccharofermentanales bacterium]